MVGCAGPQEETVRDYYIEGEVEGKWVVLCNVSGNYQRRRVHTLPCPAPKPSPLPPPPAKPVVAAGSVAATNCNVTSALQRWTVAPAAGQNAGTVTIRSADQKLCLGFDANISAYGGHGNSVVARLCGSAPTSWRWSEAVGGAFLQTALSHESCSGYPGAKKRCECAHPVACTACHGVDEYTRAIIQPRVMTTVRCLVLGCV